ncbi:hypothetical protein LAT59_03740 [Candidatus Gracilibacteria bacterium]|nr:hypothetical protein [Candidatus Gracilibacteria bacterium]
MKQAGIILTLFGILLFIFPELLSYLLGGFFVALGVILFISGTKFKKQKKHEEKFVQFGNFKIYR